MADNNNEKLVRIKHRVDTLENWETVDPILANGEIGIVNYTEAAELNTGVGYKYIVVGDGETDFEKLIKNSPCRYESEILVSDKYNHCEAFANNSGSYTAEIIVPVNLNQRSLINDIRNNLTDTINVFYCELSNSIIHQSTNDYSNFSVNARIESINVGISSVLIEVSFKESDTLRTYVDDDIEVFFNNIKVRIKSKSPVLLIGDNVGVAVIDELGSFSTKYPLSAYQGRVLNHEIENARLLSNINTDVYIDTFKSNGPEINGGPLMMLPFSYSYNYGTGDEIYGNYIKYIEVHIPGYSPVFLNSSNKTAQLYSLTDANQSLNSEYGELIYNEGSNGDGGWLGYRKGNFDIFSDMGNLPITVLVHGKNILKI